MFLLIPSFFLFAFFSGTNSQKALLGLDPGDICNTVNGVDWICKPANNCRHVNFREKRPPICGFSGQSPVICCEPPPVRISEKKCREFAGKCILRAKREIGSLLSGIKNSLGIFGKKYETTTVRNLESSTFQSTQSFTESTTTVKYENKTDVIEKKIVGGKNSKSKAHKHMRKKKSVLILSECAEWGEKCSNVIRLSRQIATTVPPMNDLTSENPTNDTVLQKQFVVGGHDAKSKIHPNMDNATDGIEPSGIVGGQISKPKANKNMALLGYGRTKNQVEWNCGGSLISERHVLTAAHCTASNLGKPKWARMGELDLSTDKDDARPQDRNIVEWINHPDYDSQTVYNDIAIYVLDKNVEFTDWVAPACLHTSSDIPATHATVTGFGRVDFVGDVSKTLQEVTIALVDGPECRELYGGVGDPKTPSGINVVSQICAGEKDGGKDACSGDSGGPMVIDVPGRCLKTQIGITSFGKNCGLPNTPGIYTRVSHYIDWIEKTVWPRD